MSETQEMVPGSRRAVPGWIKSVVPVAVAAILGAAGMVAVSSPDDASEARPTSGDRSVRAQTGLISPKPFHPRTERGRKLAKVAYRFQFEALPRHKERMVERIESIIEVINHESVRLMMGRTPAELTSREGQIAIERELIDKLNEVVFPDGLGTVDVILWEQAIVR